MPVCVNPTALAHFLDLIGVKFHASGPFVLVEATTRTTAYFWDGVLFCFGGGLTV